MATINVGATAVNYSFGALIALVVLILAIVFMFVPSVGLPFAVLCFIAALALSRLC